MIAKRVARNSDYEAEHNGEAVVVETSTVDVKDKTKRVLSSKKGGRAVSARKTKGDQKGKYVDWVKADDVKKTPVKIGKTPNTFLLSTDFFDTIDIQMLEVYRGIEGSYFLLKLLTKIYQLSRFRKTHIYTVDSSTIRLLENGNNLNEREDIIGTMTYLIDTNLLKSILLDMKIILEVNANYKNLY